MQKMKSRHRGMRHIHSVSVEACERRMLLSTYTVNTTSDSATPPPNELTLRQAVADADANPGTNTIAFSSTAFPAGSTNMITLTQGELSLTNNTTIQGPGAGVLTIDGNKSSRVFQISSGVTVSITALTITDGSVTNVPNELAAGGGVLNAGTLDLTNVTVSNNSAVGGDITGGYAGSGGIGGAASGGGIYSTGTFSLVDSVVSGNTIAGGSVYYGTGGKSTGGRIYSSGPLTVTDSVISGNTASGGSRAGSVSYNGGSAYGGGIYATDSLSLSSSTVSDNSAQGGDGFGGGLGGTGAPAEGGGICISGSSGLAGDTFTGNSAVGGNSGTFDGYAGAASGGAIFSSGSMSLAASILTDNTATGGSGPPYDHGAGGNAYGGAIAALGTLAVSASSVTSNSAIGGDGNAAYGDEVSASGYGGGIYSTESLAITASTISGNTAESDQSIVGYQYGGSGGVGQGGGVFTSGAASITSTTIATNITKGGNGDIPYIGGTGGSGGPGEGGGIYSGGTLTITNSTLANDQSTGGTGATGGYDGGGAGGAGGDASGSALYSINSVIVDDSTISRNTTTGGAGGAASSDFYPNGSPGAALAAVTIASGTATFTNTIISGNIANGTTEDDIQGTANASSASNLIGSGGGLTTGINGNTTGVFNPDLSPLQYNGGLTETLYPLPGSPAINAGNTSLIPLGVTTDQRGDARIVESSADIGSVEAAGVSISGTVYYDPAGTGTDLSGDTGIQGVTVYADLSGSGAYMLGDPSTVTAFNGTYTLHGIPQGTVIIREILQGTRQSYPASGEQEVTVASTPLTGVNFAQAPKPHVLGAATASGAGQSGVVTLAPSLFSQPATEPSGILIGTAQIQTGGSANSSSAVKTLFTISPTPATIVLTDQSLTNPTAYRYYRYLGPAESFCNIAELEFFG